jgi:dephospho-CoA kinase
VLWVGLTGGVASGKSTVARLLEAHGAAVRDADAVVEELYAGGEGAAAVQGLFGASVMAADGSVDRHALGRVVLADAEARQRLEGAVHPLVRAELASWRASLERLAPPPAVAVVEAALLLETGLCREYDRLVVVMAPLAARRQRALAAAWQAGAFEKVVAAQASDEARAAVADYLVENISDPNALDKAVSTLWELLEQDAATRLAGRALPARRGHG